MTHRWNYEYPNNAWERMPWQIRWPVGLAMIIYFGGALLVGFLGLVYG